MARRIAAARSSATPLAMGQAFLDLYAATGNRDWLTAAAKAGDFVATFRDEAGGFFTSKTSEGKTGVFAKPAKLIDDQIQVARFMNLLNRYFGNEAYREQAVACDALSRQRIGRDGRGRCPACCSPTRSSRSSRPI